jgi:hypothetical protein
MLLHCLILLRQLNTWLLRLGLCPDIRLGFHLHGRLEIEEGTRAIFRDAVAAIVTLVVLIFDLSVVDYPVPLKLLDKMLSRSFLHFGREIAFDNDLSLVLYLFCFDDVCKC